MHPFLKLKDYWFGLFGIYILELFIILHFDTFTWARLLCVVFWYGSSFCWLLGWAAGSHVDPLMDNMLLPPIGVVGQPYRDRFHQPSNYSASHCLAGWLRHVSRGVWLGPSHPGAAGWCCHSICWLSGWICLSGLVVAEIHPHAEQSIRPASHPFLLVRLCAGQVICMQVWWSGRSGCHVEWSGVISCVRVRTC